MLEVRSSAADCLPSLDQCLLDIMDIAEKLLIASQIEDGDEYRRLSLSMEQALDSMTRLVESEGSDPISLMRVKEVLCNNVIMEWLSLLGVKGDVLTSAVAEGVSDFRSAMVEKGLVDVESFPADDRKVFQSYPNDPFLTSMVSSHLILAVRAKILEGLRRRATLAPLIGEYGFMQQDFNLGPRLKRYFRPDARRGDDADIASGKRGFAILFIDLDRFKLWNDTFAKLPYPHKYGDAVLRAVARCVSSALRPSDIKIRRGGEELVIVLDGISSRDDALRKAGELCRLVASLNKEDFRADLGDDTDNVDTVLSARETISLTGYASLSIGVTTFVGSSATGVDSSRYVSGIMGIADTLAFAVKENGRNGFAFLDGDVVVIRHVASDGTYVECRNGPLDSIKKR